MALLTLGSLATGLGMVWKYWRVPVRFFHWFRAKEVEPQVGQKWREANLSGPNRDWKITETAEHHISIESLTEKETLQDSMEWPVWTKVYVGKRRLYCVDTNTSLEDQFWGEASED